MSILIISRRAEKNQIFEMLAELETLIKLAVDVERRVIAGGGEYHSDCEEALLNDGSKQDNVWGADWVPERREVKYLSMINVRPALGNNSMDIQIENLRTRIESIVMSLLDIQ
ncbi:MAG TPA: DUF5674 family protein [Candidatus Glassbacteria bacterium]|nr:DUF5674 family protein [Candidatus Glassbacteria bacterium]